MKKLFSPNAAAIKDQIHATSTPSQEQIFNFEIQDINTNLSPGGKMLKIERDDSETNPRWNLLISSQPTTGETVFSYLVAGLEQKETLSYLQGFLVGMKEETNVSDSKLQTLVDYLTAFIGKV